MPENTLAARVENIERRMGLLEALPERVRAVELQLTHLRTEMREQFSAIGQELREEIQAGDEETRRYMRVLHEEVISRIAMLEESRPRRRKQ